MYTACRLEAMQSFCRIISGTRPGQAMADVHGMQIWTAMHGICRLIAGFNLICTISPPP